MNGYHNPNSQNIKSLGQGDSEVQSVAVDYPTPFGVGLMLCGEREVVWGFVGILQFDLHFGE